MTVPFIQLRSRLAPAEVAARAGQQTRLEDMVLELRGDADIYKPDGEPLILLRRQALSEELTTIAHPALRDLRRRRTQNRGKYAGQKRVGRVMADGVLSKNADTTPIASAVVGYFDRQGGRFPFCRATAFTAEEVECWQTIVPLVEEVGRVFERVLPDRCAIQLEFLKTIRPEFVIRGTPFTTLTVNNNVAPSGVHRDAGDYKAGFGLIGCLRRGSYRGAALVFPEYQVGVELGDRDLLFFNSHDWHGVTPMLDSSSDAERITIVFYVRERMARCLSPKEELAHAKRTRGALG